MEKLKQFRKKLRMSWKNFAMSAAGSLLFAIGMNIFIIPHSLYNGGLMGIAMLIRSFISNTLGLDLLSGFDLTGIFYFMLNIPLLILAYRRLGKVFFYRTITMTIILTALMSFIKVYPGKIIEDPLTAILVGGMITGLGNGLTLSGGFCAGGQDILGVYFTKVRPNFSVGKLTLIFNSIVFVVMALTHDFEILIYSLLFTAVQSLVTDRYHMQNINITLTIFTKVAGVDQIIMKEFGRGVTNWTGVGAYTQQETKIHFTVVNKFEVNQITRAIRRLDPQAFIVITEDSKVLGNFEKRL